MAVQEIDLGLPLSAGPEPGHLADGGREVVKLKGEIAAAQLGRGVERRGVAVGQQLNYHVRHHPRVPSLDLEVDWACGWEKR
eukprot:scaffold263150_cov37-Prasinocladus_malaysianus.AAC.1